eukprot:31413-Pelagococcus_subviridis.AAC.6
MHRNASLGRVRGAERSRARVTALHLRRLVGVRIRLRRGIQLRRAKPHDAAAAATNERDAARSDFDAAADALRPNATRAQFAD